MNLNGKLFLKYLSLLSIILLTVVFVGGCLLLIAVFFPALGGFDNRFFTAQMLRLLVYFSPFIALTISLIIAVNAHKEKRYWISIASLLLPIIVGLISTSSLIDRVAPDPVQENFGLREEPYKGFLVLPESNIPEGFKVTERRYTKREYIIELENDDGVKMRITEGDNIMFANKNTTLVESFNHKGIEGHIYHYLSHEGKEEGLKIIWLNPPKQRLVLWVGSYPLPKEYSSEFLYEIFYDMVEQQ